MSKCKMIVARSDESTITFVCVRHGADDEHSIYQRKGTLRFRGVVSVGRVLWATRCRGVRI